jgi:hypothetical protein
MKNLRFILSMMLVSALIAVSYSCNKDDDDNDDDPEPSKQELLLDKTWYSIGDIGSGSQIYNSDGTYIFQPAGNTGTWTWGPNDSMYFVSSQGAQYTFWFIKIEKDYMEFWPTYEPEGNIYKWSTTKP